MIQRDYWKRKKEWVKDGILILIEWYPARAKVQLFFIITVRKIVPVYWNVERKWERKMSLQMQSFFFLERQYILHKYLYDSGLLWKKYFDDLLSWKTQFHFKIMTETVKLVLNFCLLITHIYSTCTGTCIYVNMI